MRYKKLNNPNISWKNLSTQQIISGLTDVALHWMMRLLPIDVCSALGSYLGKILGPRHKNIDQRLRKNIHFLRPDLTVSELEKTVKNWWGNHGRVLAEFSVLRRLWRSNRTKIMGIEHINYAKKTGRPVIFLLLHTANWEITGPKIISLFNHHGIHIYQEIDNCFQLKIANNIRAPYAHLLIKPNASSARKIYQKLMSGYFLMIAADECINGKLNAPSFGRTTSTPKNILYALRFAKLTNAILLPIYTTRTRGAHFKVNVLPSLVFDFTKFNNDDLQAAQIKIDGIIDNIIRENVDQWYYATAKDLTSGN